MCALPPIHQLDQRTFHVAMYLKNLKIFVLCAF